MTAEGCQKMTAMLRAACAFIATVVLVGIAACEDAPAAEPIVIATASPGGPYLAYGQGLARILSRELGQEVTAQSTQGPAQNVVLLERKQATLAFITMGVGLQAWNGSDWTKGTQYRSMRVIFPMYDTAFQFVAAKRPSPSLARGSGWVAHWCRSARCNGRCLSANDIQGARYQG